MALVSHVYTWHHMATICFISAWLTLVRHRGIVYGRATLKVRLCACPGRDRVKEQGGNREASADEDASATSAEPPRKRRRGRSSTAPAPTPEAPSPVAQLPSSASSMLCYCSAYVSSTAVPYNCLCVVPIQVYPHPR